jgi:hypothetical protein
MRSTQFDDHLPYEEQPEEHRGRNQPDTLCETTKRPTYARSNQVRLYDCPKEALGFLHKQLASAHNAVIRSSANTSGSTRRMKRFVQPQLNRS